MLIKQNVGLEVLEMKCQTLAYSFMKVIVRFSFEIHITHTGYNSRSKSVPMTFLELDIYM